MYYFPSGFPFLLLLTVVVFALVVLVEMKILSYAYSKVGIGHRYMFLLLLTSLLGSYINIPVTTISSQQAFSSQLFSYYGVQHAVPFFGATPPTVLAVNLGGAVIPSLLSLYLVIRNRLYLQALIGIGIVTAVVHMTARPVPGVGIVEPLFIPVVVTTAAALLISRRCAPSLAYVAGSLGTLIGADLLNLGTIAALGAPVASIGGAGTFDGIFMTGVLSVLIAGFMGIKGQTCNPSGERP